ncbi:hypothetical protein [Streptomyces sp. NPDC048350]|uniref:hypothetical protein n=1 Tax=Streptomyces sp. NPDC048350 TaxID=3365538 RepID=UPI0037229A79
MPFAQGYLNDVAPLDGHVTWAVGDEWQANGGERPVLVRRDDRDGRGWQVVSTPDSGQDDAFYNNVDVASAQDVWVVGGTYSSGNVAPASHWDGTSWKSAGIPVPENCSAGQHVAAISANEAWAGGWYCVPESGMFKPLLRHWDGSTWTPVEVPAAADLINITAMEATASDDVWAIGYGGDDQPRAMHYDGTAWTPVPLPVTGLYGELYDIVARGPHDVWAVGRTLLDEEDWGHSLVLHYDGTAWRQVTAPSEAGRLASVALTPTGITALGEDVPRLQSLVLTGGTDGLSLRTVPDTRGKKSHVQGIAVNNGKINVVGSVADQYGNIAPLMMSTGL